MKIATNLDLPLAGVTQTFAVMGIRGSGKTTAGLVLAEEMLKAGQPVCIYDPVGACFGLKTSADGKRPGFPAVIFGGEHADVPLEESAGETIARVIVEKRLPAILDCSLMRKGARVRFMTDFCETLYHRNREPLHFMVDEAHTIAPQKPFPEVTRLLGAMEDIVLQGRRRGLGCTIISQRPALVNKNILTQCAVLVAMRIIGPQDRRAIEDWIEAHGDESQSDELLKSLPTLKVGEGWLWSPGWLNVLKRITFRKRETFDSSATPEVGKRVVTPKVVAEVDLAALGDQIRATVEKAKADDPRELRRRISALEKELAAAKEAKPAPERVEVSIIKPDDLTALQYRAKELETILGHLREYGDSLSGTASRLTAAILGVRFSPRDDVRSKSQDRRIAEQSRPVTPKLVAAPAGERSAGSIGNSGKRRMLIALAQNPAGVTPSKLSLLTGLSKKSGTWATYLAALRSSGFVENRANLLAITDAGLAALGAYDPLPTGEALIDYWRHELGAGGLRRMFDALVEAYPRSLSRDEIGERAGLSTASGTFATYLAKLRTLELAYGHAGDVRASDVLFE